MVILIVEDEEPIREFVRGALVDEGYVVIEARNGATALEAARREQPTLILTDLMMPVMDGVALCRALKGDPRTCSVPIVVMTASGRTVAAACGADAYLTKPFELDHLLRLVAHYARPPTTDGR